MRTAFAVVSWILVAVGGFLIALGLTVSGGALISAAGVFGASKYLA